MADQKISAMPAAATLDGTEITPIVQTGVNKQVTTADYVSQVLDVNPATETQGGTGLTSYTLGDTLYGSGTNTLAKLAGNTTNTQKFLAQTGTGAVSAAPSWEALSASSINAAYFSAYQNGDTTLTSAIPNSTSTAAIQVASTADFASAGYIIIGQEIIQYTSKTATSFGGTITRGIFSSTKGSHSIGANVTEAAVALIGTAAAMVIDVVVVSNDITCTVPDSKIYFTNSGIYNLQFSAQLLNYTTSEDNVTVWFRKNNNDLPYTASVLQVPQKHGTAPGAQILALNLIDQFNAGDYFELVWASDTGETVLATFPAGTSPVHPVSPSLIVTVTQVA